MGEVKDLLQLVQLLGGEGGSDSPLALSFLWMEEGSSWVSDLMVSTLVRLLCCLVSLFQPLLSIAESWPLAPLPGVLQCSLSLSFLMFIYF